MHNSENSAFLLGEFIIFFVGIAACWGLTVSYLIWNRRKSRRIKMNNVRINLKQVGMSWDTNEARIKPSADVDYRLEGARELKWLGLAGIILSIASWLGFIILSVLIASLEFLARPRLERALFESELAFRSPLPIESVNEIVNELRNS